MKLLTGPANSGKTDLILARITKAIREKQRNAVLIVPSLEASNEIWPQLRREAEAASFGVQSDFITFFPDLYGTILGFQGIAPKQIRPITRIRYLRRTVASLARENELTYFHNIADKAGLIDSLAAFLDELRGAGLNARNFTRLTAGRDDKDYDMALIFERYEMMVRAANLIDAEGMALLALHKLEDAMSANANGNQQLIPFLQSRFSFVGADGFDAYTPVQVRMLALLDAIGIETAATLTYEDDRAVHLWQQPTIRRFEAVQAEVIRLTARGTTPISSAAAALMKDEVDNHTQSEIAQEADHDKPLTILSAPDRAAEARAIAREIKRLVKERKMAYAEITVLCRSVHLYAHHFERVCSEHQIPFQIDAALPLCENPCVVALLGLLRLASEAFPRRAVIDALRSPYFDWSGFGLDSDSIDILERISYDEFITGGREQWREAIVSPTKAPSGKKQLEDSAENQKDNEEGADRRLSLATKLDHIFDTLTISHFAGDGEYVHRISNLIETLQTGERLERPGQGATSACDKAALQKFQELLTAFGESEESHADESRRSTWLAFFEEFERAARSSSFARPQENASPDAELERSGVAGAELSANREAGQSRVVIQEAAQMRPRNYRAVFIAGLIEGEFPKGISETSPYTLAERQELRQAGIDLAESPADAGADLVQFHKAMTRAGDALFLSYARTDLAGGELLKSYLLDEVESVAGSDLTTVTIRQTSSEQEALGNYSVLSLEELALVTAGVMGPSIVGAGNDRRRKATSDGPLAEAETLLASQLKSWKATVRGAMVEQRRLLGRERGMFGGFVLNEELVKKLEGRFGADYLWSATRINDYGQCPFLFFARDVLNLAPVIEPVESFAADRLGDAYHKILERTFWELKKQGVELSAETLSEAVAISDAMSEAVLKAMLEERKVRENRLWEFDKRDIKKRVVNLLRAEIEENREQPATPVAFEKPFGWHGEPPLVVETAAAGDVKFTGIIDRLDEREDGLVVIDYKTRRTPIHAREAMEGRNLQLPIYLMAASRLQQAEKPVAGGFYLHISSCKRGSEFPNKNTTVEEVIDQAKEFIGDYVGRIRRAEFPVEPTMRDCDSYCRYHVMCRIQSLGIASREDE